jgi:hypothetical protein
MTYVSNNALLAGIIGERCAAVRSGGSATKTTSEHEPSGDFNPLLYG